MKNSVNNFNKNGFVILKNIIKKKEYFISASKAFFKHVT